MNLVYFTRKNWKGNVWLVIMGAGTIRKTCLELGTGLYVNYEFECIKFSKQEYGEVILLWPFWW